MDLRLAATEAAMSALRKADKTVAWTVAKLESVMAVVMVTLSVLTKAFY